VARALEQCGALQVCSFKLPPCLDATSVHPVVALQHPSKEGTKGRMKHCALRLVVCALIVSVAQGFAAKKSSLADDAVSVFQTAFPKKEPYKAAQWVSWGVPSRDIDGTPIKVAESGEVGRRQCEIDANQCRASFAALSKVYGEEQSLEMTRIMPIILTFEKKCFEPSFKEWSEIFGDDEARAMVLRNPGLLAVRPEDAATATDQTMNFSYVVAYTRPFSKILLPGLIFLLFVPTLEAVTGVSIRGAIFN